MEPVKTDQTTIHYDGYGDVEGLDFGYDAPSGLLFSVWEASDAERAAIAQGSRLVLASPVPVVTSLTVEA